MRTVRELLAGKPPELHAIGPDAAVVDALKVMAEHGIGAVLVMDGPRLAGVLSERDYARKVVLEGRASSDTPVREIMTTDVATVAPGDTVDACMQLVTERRIRHLPVREGEAVVGIVSIGDLVKAVIAAQRSELDQLQRYIAG